MPRNRIYESLFGFKCEKTDNETGKPCTGSLHPTNRYSGSIEFQCSTCNKYTTMNYQVANIINNDTGKPPKKHRG